MRKTFCDREGHECINRTGRVHVTVEQHTNKGQTLGVDEYAMIELCGECVDLLVEMFGGRIIGHHSEDIGMDSEMVRAEPANMPNPIPAPAEG